MEEIILSYKKNGYIHHSYILEGPKTLIVEELGRVFRDELNIGFETGKNYWHQDFDKLLMENADEIREWQSRKNISNQKSFYVISFSTIGKNAQNSLLKLVEEPQENTHFFFVVPNSSIFLDTVLSRSSVLKPKFEIGDSNQIFEILKMNMAERAKFIDKFQADLKDGKRGKGEAVEMVQSLISKTRNNLLQDPQNTELQSKLRLMQKAETYLNDESAIVKNWLEFVVLNA